MNINEKKNYLFSFIVDAFFIVFFIFAYGCHYDATDDFVMKSISSGMYGHPDEHLIFMNVLQGFLLKGLYNITNTVPWYDLLLYIYIYI